MPATDDESDKEAAAPVPTAVTFRDCEICIFVCCQYDGKWWIGHVRDKSDVEDVVQIGVSHLGPQLNYIFGTFQMHLGNFY